MKLERNDVGLFKQEEKSKAMVSQMVLLTVKSFKRLSFAL